jgi:hypothetical protein
VPLRCVTDTNVWIDLHVGGLLGAVFELDAAWMIPDLLLARELDDPPGERLISWGLRVLSLDGGEIERVATLGGRYPRPSQVDLATLVLAGREDAVLVTGDGALREAADEEGIEVHGTIWVVDQLVESDIVASQEAARGLELMLDAERRLPKGIVRSRIERWA